MIRLTIHLKQVEKKAGKIFNTLAFVVKNKTEGTRHINAHKNNTKKFYFSNIN